MPANLYAKCKNPLSKNRNRKQLCWRCSPYATRMVSSLQRERAWDEALPPSKHTDLETQRWSRVEPEEGLVHHSMQSLCYKLILNETIQLPSVWKDCAKITLFYSVLKWRHLKSMLFPNRLNILRIRKTMNASNSIPLKLLRKVETNVLLRMSFGDFFLNHEPTTQIDSYHLN